MCCVLRLAMDLPVCCVVMPADEAKADRVVSQAEVEAQVVHFLVLLSSSTV
jgi:hypothetical protein